MKVKDLLEKLNRLNPEHRIIFNVDLEIGHGEHAGGTTGDVDFEDVGNGVVARMFVQGDWNEY